MSNIGLSLYGFTLPKNDNSNGNNGSNDNSFANKHEEDIKKQDIVKWQNEDPIQYKNVLKLV